MLRHHERKVTITMIAYSSMHIWGWGVGGLLSLLPLANPLNVCSTLTLAIFASTDPQSEYILAEVHRVL